MKKVKAAVLELMLAQRRTVADVQPLIAYADMTDEQLVESVQNGENEAYAHIVRRYQSKIYAYIMRLTNHPVEAQDILQEVFIGVWTGSGKFQGRAQVKTWLFRIAHYQTATWLRNQKRYAGERDDAIENLEDQENETPETLAFDAWNFSQIQKALCELSADHREAIELSFTHGFSNAEIAIILDCPVGTVKSRLHNALRNLNGILATQEIINKDRNSSAHRGNNPKNKKD